jgi:hypothetical protein
MPDLRASDADRERTVGHLRHHAAAGRLTVDELDERCAQAFQARTVAELGELTADLPPAPPRVPARTTEPPPPGAPGVRPFTYETDLPAAPQRAIREAVRHIAPALNRRGYELVERADTRLGFAYSYRPGWVWAVALLLPPFGWFALLHKDEERVTIDFDPGPGGGTWMTIRGRAPRRVRKAFGELLG